MDTNGRVDIEDYKIKAAQIIANGGFVTDGVSYGSDSDDDGYEASFGGDDQKEKESYCYVQDNNTGEQYEIDCNKHLFPKAPGKTTGDGSFGASEERFWRTDPDSNDTANLGHVDEANVAGLGVMNFTWDYQRGDQVGLVVEGISTDMAPSADSSFKTMWAMTNKAYSEKEDGEINKVSDLNNLLYEALVSPSENSAGSNKLDISLDYSPDTPINDPTGGDEGDMLSISSSISNAEDSDFVFYEWKVYETDKISHKDLQTDATLLSKSQLLESENSTGLGIDTFKFKLALENPKKYLYVLLTATENVGSSTPRKGVAHKIIPITSNNGAQISAYIATATDSASNPAKVNLSLGSEICNADVAEKAVCPVTKNQIVGLSVSATKFPPGRSSFLWKIDGKAFSYPYCYFTGCKDDQQTNVAYFPVTKELGEQHTVNLIAENLKTGERTNLTRTFKVADPNIKIVSADVTNCDNATTGTYIDTNGESHENKNELNFWANICADKIKLKVLPDGQYNWTVDGSVINSSNASNFGFDLSGNVLSLPPKENLEQSYNVTASAVYTQDNSTKKALNKIWGIPYSQFYEKPVSDDAVITMVECGAAAGGVCDSNQTPSKKIFATIYSSAPAYLAFLLRIVLTVFVMLFTTKLIFSFLPETESEEN